MDRKGIIAISLAFAVLLIWQLKFAPMYAPPPVPPGEAAAAGSPGPSASPAASAPAITPAGATATTPAVIGTEPKVPELFTTVAGAQAKYHFTNHGGGIAWVDLTSYPAESGSNVTLNFSGANAIGALSVTPGQGADLPYTVTHQGATVVCARQEPGGLSITKTFGLPASSTDAHGYLVTLDLSFTNHSSSPIQSPGYYLYLGSASPVHKTDLISYLALDWDANGKSDHIDTMWFNAKRILVLGPETRPEQSVYTSGTAPIVWAAVSNQYFTTLASARGGTLATGAWAQRFVLPGSDPSAKPVYGMDSAIQLPPFTVAPGKSVSQGIQFYAGPKFYATLKGLGAGQERIITYFFSFWGMSVFRPVSVFLLNTLNVFHGVTRNYAIAIILLTLCIRIALWPIQNKATASMRQMQELTPRINELKEKYKDDPNRMNAEVMKLYKEYNINPLAGCLPMFVQIPIFFGFYRVLGTAIELRNSHFLWVTDLSQPDTVFHIAGYPVNILPMFMAVTMVAQMSLQPKTGDPSQQRMMMFVPLIFIFMCYNFASALALYWTVQNVFSITQLYVTRKRTAPAPLKPVARRKSR